MNYRWWLFAGPLLLIVFASTYSKVKKANLMEELLPGVYQLEEDLQDKDAYWTLNADGTVEMESTLSSDTGTWEVTHRYLPYPKKPRVKVTVGPWSGSTRVFYKLMDRKVISFNDGKRLIMKLDEDDGKYY